MKNIFILIFLFSGIGAFSQWECRSNLSGHLKPISEDSKLSWAAEVVGAGGYLSDSYISSGMTFLGLDYTNNNHQVYIEGGGKYWNKYDIDLATGFSKSTLGLREFSYNYFTPSFTVNAGLHQITLADYFLVNERAWGASINKEVGGFDFNVNVASVTKDFARNGIFCSNCFLYDIVPSRNYPLGNAFWETNFAAFSLKKEVGAKKENVANESPDEFEEFDEFSEFEDVQPEKQPFLKSYGGVVYAEFGDYYNEPHFYVGLTGEFNLGKIATLKAEGLYQNVTDSRALILYLQAEKIFDWKSGDRSTAQLTFLGKSDIDDNALAMPRFSNLFMGEVFRMDPIDMPLLNATLKHRFIDQQLSMKAQYTQQLTAENMQELDVSVGKYFFKKHLRTTLIGGVMNSDELEEWSKLGRLEMRVFF